MDDHLQLKKGDALYFEEDALFILDQRALPVEESYIEARTPEEVAEAICTLGVRGAMAIGVAAAYGVFLGALVASKGKVGDVAQGAHRAARIMKASRPTARNLFWAVERMEDEIRNFEGGSSKDILDALRRAADSVARETVCQNKKLVEVGIEILPGDCLALTHCNSGALASIRYGTALSILIEAHRRGRRVHVFVDETRPLLQGSRLTAWELARNGVPHTLICDSAAAILMKSGEINIVITGADRIALNGDTANKVGTYGLAVLARHHGLPFYIAAPSSTIDLSCPKGENIPIEERDQEEVKIFRGERVAPDETPARNPAFDVTEAELISGIITEKGVIRAPYDENLKRMFSSS